MDILLGENWSWSLLGLKGLTYQVDRQYQKWPDRILIILHIIKLFYRKRYNSCQTLKNCCSIFDFLVRQPLNPKMILISKSLIILSNLLTRGRTILVKWSAWILECIELFTLSRDANLWRSKIWRLSLFHSPPPRNSINHRPPSPLPTKMGINKDIIWSLT